MSESDELYNRVARIEQKLGNIDAKFAITIATDKNILQSTLSLFKKNKSLIPVYLAVDGKKNVTEIANEIKSDVGNTSRRLSTLHERGYIDKVDIVRGMIIYKKNQFEKILRLSKNLQSIS